MKAILAALALTFLLPSCDSASADDAKSAGHQSSAIIQILPTTPVLTDPALRTEDFIANEIASLSMGVVVKHAAEELQIDPALIKSSLKVEALPGTDMARLTASIKDPGKAKLIVKQIIDSYMDIRRMIQLGNSEEALNALDNELIAQSDLVQDHRKDLTVLIQQYGIPYFDSQNPTPFGKVEVEMFAQSRRDLAALETEKALLLGKLETAVIEPAERKELIKQFELISSQVKVLSKRVSKRKDDVVDLSLKQYRYMQAVTTYEQANNMLRQMKAKQQEARVALKMPVSPLIVRQNPE